MVFPSLLLSFSDYGVLSSVFDLAHLQGHRAQTLILLVADSVSDRRHFVGLLNHGV